MVVWGMYNDLVIELTRVKGNIGFTYYLVQHHSDKVIFT